MKLLVLAGGFDTRLQTTLSDVPKALAPVGSVPFLHLQIEPTHTQIPAVALHDVPESCP
jgi:NDP-sugar pyrophosphorylase family protein